MKETTLATPATLFLTPRARNTWRVVQFLVWLVGVGIVAALIFVPDVGIHAFWNVLIPVAPALVVFAPGLWRNICPLASTALFACHMGFSKRGSVSRRLHSALLLTAVVILFAVVPLRHVVLDTSGPATALTLVALACVAVVMGVLFEWKSGWCSSLCPIHAVERLYGSEPIVSPRNAHCTTCEHCTTPCPDSTPSLHPLVPNTGPAQRLAGILMVGAFPGFIWGWFHVPDYFNDEGWLRVGQAFAWPLGAGAVTLCLFLALRRSLPEKRHTVLVRAFAASAVACYYWYRLPMLFGFGLFPGDGMLVDLTGTLPAWCPHICRVATTLLFVTWLVGRRTGRTWLVRPPYAVTP